MADFLLFEDGSGHLEFEDSSGALLLEPVVPTIVGPHFYYPSDTLYYVGYDLRWIVSFHKDGTRARVRFFSDPTAVVELDWVEFKAAWDISRASSPNLPGMPAIAANIPALQVVDSYYNTLFWDQWVEPAPNPTNVLQVYFSASPVDMFGDGSLPLDPPVTVDKVGFLALAALSPSGYSPSATVGYNLDNIVAWNVDGGEAKVRFYGAPQKVVTFSNAAAFEAAMQAVRTRAPYLTTEYLWTPVGTGTTYNLGNVMMWGRDDPDADLTRARFAGQPSMVGFDTLTFEAAMLAVTTATSAAIITADWVARAIANGGTVSGTTSAAVNAFVSSSITAGIWSKLVRVNLICGSYDAALTPLKVGGGFGKEVEGGLASSTYYTETGINGGIAPYPTQGTGHPTTKWYDTGWIPDAHLTPGDVHIGIYNNGMGLTSSEYRVPIGASSTAGTGGDSRRLQIDGNPFNGYTIRTYLGVGYQTNSDFNLGSGGLRGHYMATILGGATLSQVLNGVAYPGNPDPIAGPGQLADQTIFLGANHAPTLDSQYACSCTIAGYHIGHGLTQAECNTLSQAMLTFQQALGRYIHPAVGDWQRRVRQAFGNNTSWDNTVLGVLDDFAYACDAAGVTPKLRRANLFCGNLADQSRVPIFNGSTYYGQGSVVFADPLVGLTSANWLAESGWEKTSQGNAVVSAEFISSPGAVGGLAVWVREVPTKGTLVGWASASDTWSLKMFGGTVEGRYGGTAAAQVATPTPGFFHVVRASTTDLRTFHNGVQTDLNITSTTPVSTPQAPGILALIMAGTPSDDVDDWVWTCGYSQEKAALTPAQAAAYYAAWYDAQLALGRLQTYGLLTEAGDNIMNEALTKQLATEQA